MEGIRVVRRIMNRGVWKKTFKIAREYRGYDYNTVDPGSAEFKAAIMPLRRGTVYL